MNDLMTYIKEDLGLQVKNQKLIEQAFHHTSYVNEHGGSHLTSNERLEFLGDAVLELAVSNYLYAQYPQQGEGVLTRMRAQLVREPSLAYVARQLKFDRFLYLGKGEQAAGGNQRDSILSDCFEAFLAALYLDQGSDQAEAFLQRVLLDQHEEILRLTNQDYKTQFQEWIQAKGSVKIEYRLLDQTGPAHDRSFVSGLYIDGQLIAQGCGKSKKQAEMNAAKEALEHENKGVL